MLYVLRFTAKITPSTVYVVLLPGSEAKDDETANHQERPSLCKVQTQHMGGIQSCKQALRGKEYKRKSWLSVRLALSSFFEVPLLDN
jgi:hypothetical protein